MRYSFQIKQASSFWTHLHAKLEIKVLSLQHDLHLDVGHDHNLPVEYGHVGREGLGQRRKNLHKSMQWYIIQNCHVQKMPENCDLHFFLSRFPFLKRLWKFKKIRKHFFLSFFKNNDYSIWTSCPRWYIFQPAETGPKSNNFGEF